MSKRKICTELGSLKAYVRNNLNYPGIDIQLERGDKSILLAVVEVDQYQSPPSLKMRMYGDCKDDEPTDDCAISPEELSEYFTSLDNGAIELV